MNINPNYTCQENTPLKFLTFVRVTLWIGLLIRVLWLVRIVSEQFQWYPVGMNLLGVVVSLSAVYWLNRMEWNGVRAYCALFVLRALECVATIALYAYVGALEESGSVVGELLGLCLYIVLVWRYFRKRRLLFDPIPEEYWQEEYWQEEYWQEEYWQENTSEEPEMESSEPQTFAYREEADHRRQFSRTRCCPECGEEVGENMRFCPFCGCRLSEMTAEQSRMDEPWAEETPWTQEVQWQQRRSGRRWWLIGAAAAVAVVGAGVLWMYSEGMQIMTPTQAAEHVLYLEVYNSADVCIGSGSGFLIRDGRTLVTNYHVVEGATYVLALTGDWERELRVDTVLAWDEDCDLAILQCGEVLGETLTLADSDRVEQGDAIYAAGYPLGIANTLSDGIVSSRYVDELGVELLQITAPISHGSSGGALLNQQGQVIGVTSSSYVDGQNLNLAISSNEVSRMLTGEIEPRPLTDMMKIPDVYVPCEAETGINYKLCYVDLGGMVTLSMLVDGKEVPSNQVTWTSSDPEGMPVENGVVWVGSNDPMVAEITAVTKDGHKGSCAIFRKSLSLVHQESGILVYDDVPAIPSMEQVFGENPMIGFWKHFNSTNKYGKTESSYSYVVPGREEAKYYVDQYEDMLFALGFERGYLSDYEDPTGRYEIQITEGYLSTYKGGQTAPFLISIRITRGR